MTLDELLREIVDRVGPVKRCKNCGRPFLFQSGRGTQYHRRTGVLYCTRKCGKAFAERERRKRIRERAT